MTDQQRASCLSCGRTEAEAPLTAWQYQGRELRICAQCMPAFIHKTDEVLSKWLPAIEPVQAGLAPGG